MVKRRGEREGRGDRGAFHVTAIINGYIPTLSHETILVTRKRDREREKERERERRGGFE